MRKEEWLWPGGPKLIQREGVFPLGTDAVLLADFAGNGREKHICDLGCGTGVLSILLAFNSPHARVDAVDISPEAVESARHNFEINDLTPRARVFHADLCALEGVLDEGGYDLIVCNPPYFSVGAGAEATLSQARSETSCDIRHICRAAYRLGGRNSRVAFCWRPERLIELLDAMREYHLEPKRLRTVHHSALHKPLTILVEGKKDARPGLDLMPPLLLYNENGSMTPEYSRIHHLAKEDHT